MQILTTPELEEKWKEFFVASDEVIPHDVLWKQFIERQKFAGHINKLLFYIANYKAFGMPMLKAENGCLGYKLTVVKPHIVSQADHG